jgi:hypothetical protein
MLPGGGKARHAEGLGAPNYLPARERCENDDLCVAKPGHDAPTGPGTPNGTGAF